jgi:hypothetical protein
MRNGTKRKGRKDERRERLVKRWDIIARHSGIRSRTLLFILHRCEAKAAVRGSGVKRGCQWRRPPLITRHSQPAREKERANVRAPHQNVEISPPPTFFAAAMTHDRPARPRE